MPSRLASRTLIFLTIAAAAASCSDEPSSGAAANLSGESRACLMGANSMIDVARQAVADPSSRPERREARRQLLEGWVARLDAGEEPCAVYEDIGRSATTF